MKKMVALSMLVILLLTVAGCQSKNAQSDFDISQPVPSLEFWIGENVDDVDFSKYQAKYGIMGGWEYYGTGYTPTIDEDGYQVDPEYYVSYVITRYPDYSSPTSHITSIYIQDPSVEVYGLTINSSHEEIRRVMEEKGFVIQVYGNGTAITATLGDYTFSFHSTYIYIRVEVANEQGLVF